MHALRHKCRPKHQVLILNCYPRTTKGAVDVKPNSSELSYLLYYATTRRSKVQKVGEFLEKKTASDVWRARIGNIQVTLQILAALIEKAPRDLPLYASYVLKTFNIILRAHDLTTVESSLPTFDSFCQHHDEPSLHADQEYLRQYAEIVGMYASFASKKDSSLSLATSKPISLRWRSLGLQAIKSVVSSEALATLAGRQLDVIVPTLLDNIWSENPELIDSLEHRAQAEEKHDTRRLSRRHTSISTVRTVETSADKKAALSSTTADADKVAEADIGVLAVKCLKLVFVVNNKSQIHDATLAILRFIAARVNVKDSGSKLRSQAVRIYLLVSASAPVQDRYTILVTTMENLIQIPLIDENLQQQLALATLINSLLKSDINLVGLSVMDVLLGLMQYILRVIQASRPPSHDANSSVEHQLQSKNFDRLPTEDSVPNTFRKKLLKKLQSCIGNLATHVYYSDQISDMVAALLLRLKPPPNSGEPNSGLPSENASVAAIPTATASGNQCEDNKNDFFSFDTAKLKALEAIKSILLVASFCKNMCGGLARNCVPIQVWEGTQWLLRDSSGRVRKSYVAALLTWMEHEITKTDLRASEEKCVLLSRTPKYESAVAPSKRAVSNTSYKEKVIVNPPDPNTFLELLHLSIYENALKYFESEEDIVLLHLILTSLVEHLGVNAVKNGLPMIFCLQEYMVDTKTPLVKIRIGSLCHGYFWTLSEKFDIGSSLIKKTIQSEIHRRQSNKLWIDKICYPPIPLEQTRTPPPAAPSQPESFPLEVINLETLLPFNDRSQLIKLISSYYENSLMLQLTSPASPGRTPTQPIFGTSGPNVEIALPEKIKVQMMSEWSRETVISTIRERIKTVSLSGSKNGTTATGHRKFLSVNGRERTQSPNGQNLQLRVGSSSRPCSNNGLASGLGALQKLRISSGQLPSALSESSHNSITRVEQLKRVLCSQEGRSTQNWTAEKSASFDDSSESLVSYDYTASEISFNQSQQNIAQLERPVSNRAPNKATRSKSRDMKDKDPAALVPSISRPFKNEAMFPPDHAPPEETIVRTSRRKGTPQDQDWEDRADSVIDLENFINNIEVGPERVRANTTKPPY